jgi:hypothetical protein
MEERFKLLYGTQLVKIDIGPLQLIILEEQVELYWFMI